MRYFKTLGFKVAPRKVSYSFAWEVDCPDLEPLSSPPMALHSAWLVMNRDIIHGLIEANFLDTNQRIQTLPKTVDGIIDLFSKSMRDRGDTAKPQGTIGLNNIYNTNITILFIATTDTLSNEAWLLLQNNLNSMNSDNKGILDVLNKAGLASQSDLPLLSADSIQQISSFLKIVPKKKFLTIMSNLKTMTASSK